MRRQHATTTLNRVLLPSLRRRKGGNCRKISSSSGNGSSSSNSSNGSRRMSHTPVATSASDTSSRDSWDVENLASCAARKQVRVSLDSVLNVSTGRAPWTNPELRAHGEVGKNRSSAVDPDAPGHVLDTDFACTTAEVGQLQSAQYLHRELPIRLASAILELDKVRTIPLGPEKHVARWACPFIFAPAIRFPGGNARSPEGRTLGLQQHHHEIDHKRDLDELYGSDVDYIDILES